MAEDYRRCVVCNSFGRPNRTQLTTIGNVSNLATVVRLNLSFFLSIATLSAGCTNFSGAEGEASGSSSDAPDSGGEGQGSPSNTSDAEPGQSEGTDASDASSSSDSEPQPGGGAVATGVYRNLFGELGYSDEEIDAKLNAA